jgi:putative ABC transport system substrate-binding protein
MTGRKVFQVASSGFDWSAAFCAAATVILVLLAVSIDASLGQQSSHQLLGFLSSSTREGTADRIDIFKRHLRDLGYQERDIVIDYRWTNGRDEQLPVYANELVKQGVKVIITHGNLATEAASRATTKIPIVCFTCGDLRLVKGVASLARPGGNITGVSSVHPDTASKRLQLLRDLIPGLSKVDVLYNIGNPVSQPELRSPEEAAQLVQIQMHPLGVKDPDELRTVLSSRTRQDADALLVTSDAMIQGRIPDIVALAVAKRMPVITPWGSEFVRAGGLIGYGPDTLALIPQAASQVDKILRGATPGDLPIEQPTKFELYINAKAAASIGLTVPSSILVQATEVVD